MDALGTQHLRQIHFFVQSATGLFQKNEQPRPCFVVFGINGCFFQTAPQKAFCPEWNEVQQFDISSDLLTLHIYVRDDIISLLFSSTEPQKIVLKHKKHSDLTPVLFYRSNVLSYRRGAGNRFFDWVFEKVPLFTESIRNAQVIEWTWPNCRSPSNFQTEEQIRSGKTSTVTNEETMLTTSPFLSSIKEAVAVSTLFNNPNFLEGEQVEVNSAIPLRATVCGGTRIIIGGSNFGLDISNIRLLLIAGCDCTKMIQSHSTNQIHVLTRRFYPVSSEIVVVTKSNGTAISDFEFTFFDESNTLRKLSTLPLMPPPKQLRSTCTQTQPPDPESETLTLQVERIGKLEDLVDKLQLENKRQTLYLDQLVSRIMEMCPAILSSKD
ncbi:hypothetical protein L596_003544 [Steinernema carpocapsae]|uniref:IPT/TIG domain-containing protein n=1 Tax=Steinernema carpocapsae TaxID=34508 RepID=A0A4U8UUJ0_STECR|nr:hypothetical protein L596_003544 [Steinernema carpocapsae]